MFRRLITNNLETINALGGDCVYCDAHLRGADVKETTDDSTVICPRCGVDAVLPAGTATAQKRAQLRERWFSAVED